MKFIVDQQDDGIETTSQAITFSQWLRDNISVYTEFSPKLGHYEGVGWKMRATRVTYHSSDQFSVYKWVWEIQIEDDKLATEFALRFL